MDFQGERGSHPKMRPVEAFPIDMEGRRQICLRDPLRICENVILVTEPAFWIIAQFDGAHSAREIQHGFMARFGETIPMDSINRLAGQLDEAYLLDSDRFHKKYDELEMQFESLPAREPALAGISYEGDPGKLKANLDAFFSSYSGKERAGGGRVRGIVAPHIDINIGARSFAAAYERLRGCDAELYIILGTAHNFAENMFNVVPKDFMTPLGALPVDRPSVDYLRSKVGGGIFKQGFVHRNEHSIEFQTIFLRYILGPDNPATILPVLCSSFQPLLDSKTPPAEHHEASVICDALREISRGRKTCFIAGVDLAHVGLKFGDQAAPSPDVLNKIEKLDMELVDTLGRIDPAAFFEHFTRDNDARRVCGFSPLGIFINSISASEGEMLDYTQACDDQTGSVVTFVSMAFY